jgi:cell division protein FtsB
MPPTVRPRFTGRAAILVLVMAVLVMSYASSLRAYLEQRHHLQTLRSGIAESRGSIAALEREQKRWQDPAFLRAKAHERLGWVLPGEIAFQVIDEDGKPLDDDDTLTGPGEEAERSAGPLWWQSAWQSVELAGVPKQERETPRPATRIRVSKSTQR